MSISAEFILSKLKTAAKQVRRLSPSLTQAEALDKVAHQLGFNNWSLLSKHVKELHPVRCLTFFDNLYKHPMLMKLMPPKFSPALTDQAMKEMEDWVRENYSRLVDFAFYDRESENGYAWPDVDLDDELQDAFSDKYPYEIIAKVAQKLEMEGPWGVEEFGED